MKKTSLLIMLICMSFISMAQEQSIRNEGKLTQNEVGLSFRSLKDFGVSYKTGTKSSMWRFNALFMSGGRSKSTFEDGYSLMVHNGIHLSAGKEWRKEVVNNLEFRYGADLALGFSQSKSELSRDNQYNGSTYYNTYSSSTSNTYSPGFNLVLGFNYVIKEKIVIGTELLPYFSIFQNMHKSKCTTDGTYSENKQKSYGYNYGFSPKPFMVNVAFRF